MDPRPELFVTKSLDGRKKRCGWCIFIIKFSYCRSSLIPPRGGTSLSLSLSLSLSRSPGTPVRVYERMEFLIKFPFSFLFFPPTFPSSSFFFVSHCLVRTASLPPTRRFLSSGREADKTPRRQKLQEIIYQSVSLWSPNIEVSPSLPPPPRTISPPAPGLAGPFRKLS